MKKLIFIFFLMVSFTYTQAQDFKSAIGLRLGYPTSVSYKRYIDDSKAIELYGGFRSRFGFTTLFVNGALQFHKPLGEVDNLSWYYGAGAGVALGNSLTSLILSGYLGLQYTLEEAPVTFSLDWVPSFFIGDYAKGFGGDYAGLGVRYVLDGKL